MCSCKLAATQPRRPPMRRILCLFLTLLYSSTLSVSAQDVCVVAPGSPEALLTPPSSAVGCGLSPSLVCCATIGAALATLATQPRPTAAPTAWPWSMQSPPSGAARLALLVGAAMPTVRLHAGTHACAGQLTGHDGGWVPDRAVHIYGTVDAVGVPTSIVDCVGRGRAFRVDDQAFYVTNVILQSGHADAGAAILLEAGFNRSALAVVDDGMDLVDGLNRTQYPPFGLQLDLFNTQILNHRTWGLGAVTLRVQADTSSDVHVAIRGCSFVGNTGGHNTTLQDGVHAGALTLTHNGALSQSNHANLITDTLFESNTGGSDFGFGAAIGAGAVAQNYAGANSVHGCVTRFERTVWNRNVGGDRITVLATFSGVLSGFAVGAGAFCFGSGAKLTRYNHEEFVDSVFRENEGGRDCNSPIGEAAGGGAISINYVPYADGEISWNQELFSGCTFVDNKGGERNNNAPSNYIYNSVLCVAGAIPGGGAGAVSVIFGSDAFLADPTQVTQDLQSLNRNQSVTLVHNSQLIEDSTFLRNSGGSMNNLYSTPCGGGGGGAGGFMVLYAATSVYAAIESNNLTVSRSSFIGNQGGNSNNGVEAAPGNSANTGGGAGALAALYLMTIPAGNLNGNIQVVSDSLFVSNSGGNYNSFGNTAGGASAGITVFFSVSSSVQDIAQHAVTFISFNELRLNNVTMRDNVGGARNAENGNGGSSAAALSLTYFPYLLSELQANILHIYGCTFERNGGAGTLTSYGALSGSVAYTMTVYSGRSSVWNNAIDIRDTTFVNNTGATSLQGLNSLTANSGGVAVVFPYASLNENSVNNFMTITDCLFRNQSSSGGSAVWVVASLMPFQVRIVRTLFDNNRATEDGGAMRLTDIGSSLVTDTSFVRNRANTAGSLLLQGRSSMAFQRCHFDENTAVQYGSEFVIQNPSSISLDNCTLLMAAGQEQQPQQAAVVFSTFTSAAVAATANTTAQGLTSSTSFVFDNSTLLACSPGNVVFLTTVSMGCQYCRTGSYSLSNSVWLKPSAHDIFKTNPICLPCEFGADCSLGGSNIRSVVGYFGSIGTAVEKPIDVLSPASFAVPTTDLRFTLCLPTYCCTQASSEDSVCSAYNTCAPHRVGRLCGRCEDGYSEVLGSDECRSNDRCNAVGWFVPVALLAGFVLAVFVALQSGVTIHQRNADAMSKHPLRALRTPWAQSVSLLIFFFQLAGPCYVASTTSSRTSFLAGLFSALRNLFEFSPSSGDQTGGVCLWPDMSVVQKQFMYLSGPLFVLFPFIVLSAVLFLLRPHVPAIKRLESGVSPVHITSVWLIGLVRIGLLGYSTLIRRLLILVNCVYVPPEEGVFLLYSGEIECFHPWQIGCSIILGLLGLLPFGFIYLLRDKTKKMATPQAATGSLARRLSQLKIARTRLVELLTVDYKPEFRYWEGVLLVYRLAVASCSTLIPQVAMMLLVLFFCNLSMLMIHVSIRPFRSPAAQQVQTICLTNLTIISACSLPAALLISLAFTPPTESAGTLTLSWIQFTALTSSAFLALGVLLQHRYHSRSHNGVHAKQVHATPTSSTTRDPFPRSSVSEFGTPSAVTMHPPRISSVSPDDVQVQMTTIPSALHSPVAQPPAQPMHAAPSPSPSPSPPALASPAAVQSPSRAASANSFRIMLHPTRRPRPANSSASPSPPPSTALNGHTPHHSGSDLSLFKPRTPDA